MIYRSTKTYGHEVGLSCAFRQWKAASHCRMLHGYALGIRLEFEANELDENGWVIDFGSLAAVKAELVSSFDHRTLVAADDPSLPWFREAHAKQIIDMLLVQRTGCEAFAGMVFAKTDQWLGAAGHHPRVRLVSAEVREHGANSAIAFGQPPQSPVSP